MPDAADPATGGAAGSTTAATSATPAARWEALLAELEDRLGRWQVALDGSGPYPEDLSWPDGLGPCPDHLAGRARAVDAAQRDLQARLAMRREALAARLRDGARAQRVTAAPLFVDQRS